MSSIKNTIVLAVMNINEAALKLNQASKFYKERNDKDKADEQNVENVMKAVILLREAYDKISEIVENDI